MTEGEIVLLRMQQSNGDYKLRPALVLKVLPKYNDLLICGISSKLFQETKGCDEILSESADYFKDTGLRQTSLVRLLFIAVEEQQHIIGRIGKIPDSLHKKLLGKLANFLIS